MTGIMQMFVAGGAGVVRGCQSYTTPGTYTWVAPTGVTSVSAVAIGAGRGGDGNNGGTGGDLRYKNNYSVTPGTGYTVVVPSGGAAGSYCPAPIGSPAYFVNTTTLYARGGGSTATNYGCGSGAGGFGSAAGGGAAGYSGNGGQGASSLTGNGSNGAGGGAGGGGASGCFTLTPNCRCIYATAGGGGVGLLGQGSSGAGGSYVCQAGTGGGGGSNGGNGANAANGNIPGTGGNYGGGGGRGFIAVSCVCGSPVVSRQSGGVGAGGAVRIVWPGATRSFPSTDVA